MSDWELVREGLESPEDEDYHNAIDALARLREREKNFQANSGKALDEQEAYWKARLENEKRLLIEEGEAILEQLRTDQARIAELETAIREFADDFPGYSPMWESVRQFARRALGS